MNCKELPPLLGIPAPTRAEQIQSAEIRIKEIEDDIKNLWEEANRLRLEAHEYLWSMNYKRREAILVATLRQAATALEKARPSIKARAVEAADADQYDNLVGEINQVLFKIKHLNLP